MLDLQVKRVAGGGMSRSIKLFAQSSVIGLKGFVKDLQETLGLPFEYLPDDEIDFLYFAQRMNNETNSIERFWVGDHTYASTRGLPLSEYRFDIELDTSSDDWKFTPPKHEQMKDALGYTVF